MNQNKRILIALLIIVVVTGIILGVESLRGRITEQDVPPGSIPIVPTPRAFST